jgi:alkylation response protein AidB-like acyl-CoA dehydrogenase
MDLEPSEDQRLLAESARAMLGRSWDIDQVRAAGAAEHGFSPQLWQRIADAGWAGLALPDDCGGAGRGVLELTVVAEEVGRALAMSPLLVSTTLGALPILWRGSAQQRSRWLPALASGEAIVTMAEHEAPGDATRILVPFAAVADAIIVVADDQLWLVDAAELETQRHRTLGGTPLYSVTLERDRGEPLGSGDAAAVVASAFDHTAVVHLASAVGAAERALELTADHARARHQFGRPIGSFQAVAHRCVDMRSDIDACRYLIYQAAWALDHRASPELEVACARSYVPEALRRIFVNAHQVHGAIGFSTEYDLHLFTRWAKAVELSYGGPARQRERVAAAMGLDAEPKRMRE